MIPSWSYEIIGECLIEQQSNNEHVSSVKKSDSEISMENVLNSIDSMDIEMINELLEEFESELKQHSTDKIITNKELCVWTEISDEIKKILGCNYELFINICEIFI